MLPRGPPLGASPQTPSFSPAVLLVQRSAYTWHLGPDLGSAHNVHVPATHTRYWVVHWAMYCTKDAVDAILSTVSLPAKSPTMPPCKEISTDLKDAIIRQFQKGNSYSKIASMFGVLHSWRQWGSSCQSQQSCKHWKTSGCQVIAVCVRCPSSQESACQCVSSLLRHTLVILMPSATKCCGLARQRLNSLEIIPPRQSGTRKGRHSSPEIQSPQWSVTVVASWCGAVLQTQEQAALYASSARWMPSCTRRYWQKTCVLAHQLGLGWHWVFQQDKDPKHTAKMVQTWLRTKCIYVLQWPSESPDLNPIENLQALLKNQVHAHRLQNLTELETYCKEEWASTPCETCQCCGHLRGLWRSSKIKAML